MTIEDLGFLKELFIKTVRENIKRDGVEELLGYLENTDFYTAPASSKYHDSVEGGLVLHSLNVYRKLRDQNLNFEDHSLETQTLVALFHDLCKVNMYKIEMRNTKDENGKWIQVPFYKIEDELPYGHGEKSVFMLSEFLRLTQEESQAINAHMGGFDDRKYVASNTFMKVPLAVYLHIADLTATYIR